MEFLSIFFTTTVNQILTSSKNFKIFKKLQRFPKLSSDENLFIQAAFVYQEALKRAGYNHKLKYSNSDKYNSNNNNNQDICNINDTKNDNNYNNHNKFKFNHNDN